MYLEQLFQLQFNLTLAQVEWHHGTLGYRTIERGGPHPIVLQPVDGIIRLMSPECDGDSWQELMAYPPLDTISTIEEALVKLPIWRFKTDIVVEIELHYSKPPTMKDLDNLTLDYDGDI